MTELTMATGQKPIAEKVKIGALGELEECYTPEEIAKAWKWQPDTVRRLFLKEPGIMATGEKRKSIRIPKSVVERVRRRLQPCGGGMQQ